MSRAKHACLSAARGACIAGVLLWSALWLAAHQRLARAGQWIVWDQVARAHTMRRRLERWGRR